jgi:tRNA pseudouridine65 synthase
MIEDTNDAPFDILYRDAYYVAINKPPGYIVHRSPIARNATQIVLQKLRDQLGQRIYPIHRLDRKTSGVLIFALAPEPNNLLGLLFAKHLVQKEYRAIVRGWTDDQGVIDYDLINDSGKSQSALTYYETFNRYEINLPQGAFETSRYSVIRLFPKTGRMHQLRKHMAHIFHPIIGDRPHGCNKQNRMWKHSFQLDAMLLHSCHLSFLHPYTQNQITIEAPFFAEFQRALTILQSYNAKHS